MDSHTSRPSLGWIVTRAASLGPPRLGPRELEGSAERRVKSFPKTNKQHAKQIQFF